MSDDSFIREVDDEMRQDQLRALWDRYGRLLIAAAVAIVLATAGYRGWQFYSKSQAASSGDAFLAAIDQSAEGRHDEAIATLEGLANRGSGQYPALARLRIAAEIASAGEAGEAIAAYDAIAADTSVDGTLRDIAALRAGLLAVDHADAADAINRLEPMAGPGQPFRHSAREGLGLVAWKSGDHEGALRWFQAIADDQGASANMRSRVEIMLNLLAGQGVEPAGEQ